MGAAALPAIGKMVGGKLIDAAVGGGGQGGSPGSDLMSAMTFQGQQDTPLPTAIAPANVGGSVGANMGAQLMPIPDVPSVGLSSQTKLGGKSPK